MMEVLSSESNTQSEEQYRIVADNTYNWEYWRGADGGIVYCSPSCLRITGYTAEEFQQNPKLLTMIIRADDIEKFNDHLVNRDNGIAKTDCKKPEFRIYTAKGEERWIEHICHEVFDKGGKSLGRRACNNDITERKLSEETLQKLNDTLQGQKEELQINEELLRDQNYELQITEELLREQLNKYEITQKLLKDEKYKLRLSEEKFSTAFRASPDAININRLIDGMYLEINEGFSAITGYTAEDVVGKTSNELNIWVVAEDRMCLVNGLQEYGVVNNLEAEFRRKDGSILTGLMSAKIIEIENELHILSITRDMTEFKRIEEEKRIFEEQFHQAQKMESLGVLAGGIAHDFNNILTIILGHCYMARQDMLIGDEYKTAFQYVETAANRATELCRQMLDYAGKSPLLKAKVDLCLLVDEVVKMLRPAINKNVTIELDLKGDIPEINGDTVQLEQLIMNLVINAAEAIGDKEGAITVAISTMFIEDETSTDTFGTLIKSAQYVCLQISDNGIGMDEETQKRIFEPFYTTKFTGRGLGISAIHGIIKSHDGVLQLKSALGVGTTFKVCFSI